MELLVDDVWEADDDKTGFLRDGVNNFDWLFLYKHHMSLPMVETSNKNKKIKNKDKWKSSTNRII